MGALANASASITVVRAGLGALVLVLAATALNAEGAACAEPCTAGRQLPVR